MVVMGIVPHCHHSASDCGQESKGFDSSKSDLRSVSQVTAECLVSSAVMCPGAQNLSVLLPPGQGGKELLVAHGAESDLAG